MCIRDRKIEVYNETQESYDFIPGTRFATENGIVYRAADWITIPAGSPASPSVFILDVEADQRDSYGEYIGSRGNISS